MKRVFNVVLSLTVLTAGILFIISSDSEAQIDPLAPDPEPVYSPRASLPDDMNFVTIPSGSFRMGSTSEDDDEESVHTVHINEFEIMTTEVTQGMWEEVMGTSIQDQQNLSEYDFGLFGIGSDYPMYYVSWYDCQDFIDKLNDMDPNHTYRLPSEAEWEYACRAGTSTEYYWGDSDSESVMGRYCWYFINSGNRVLADDTEWDFDLLLGEWNCRAHPVGLKAPNAWGLYDMSGNVWEWCEDRWHDPYSGAPSDGSAWNSGSGSVHVARGGGWYGNASRCRSANRYFDYPGYSISYLGFRLSRD